MSSHYLETSALLRAISGEDPPLRKRLAAARRKVFSPLTLLEGYRTVSRYTREKLFPRRALRNIRDELDEVLADSEVIPLDALILERARADFPVEPVRTLDAIHLASALHWHERVEDTVLVTFDRRVWDNAVALELNVIPATRPGQGGER